MKTSTVIACAFFLFVIVLFVKSMFTPPLKVEELSYYKPTQKGLITQGQYYIDKIKSGCKGIETFQQMATDNPSLRIYGTYRKEMIKTLNYTKDGLKYFGLQNHLLDCEYII